MPGKAEEYLDPQLPGYRPVDKLEGKITLIGSDTMSQVVAVWKDSFKKYTKEMAGIPERGYAYMTDRNNVSRIVALATGGFPFRMNLFNFHNVVDHFHRAVC